MPFQREWNRASRQYIINRDRTGPPKPSPSTGTVQAEDGSVVADSGSLDIPPSTPIPVKMPGPREPVIDATGMMAPRWWRFFEELWRRTGALEDNINSIERLTGGATSGTTGSLAITGYAPSIVVGQTVPSASLSLTGSAPTVV